MSALILDSYVSQLDLPAIFGRSAALEVDLGCGDGTFLVDRARQQPSHDLLGTERLPGRVATTSRKIERLNLANVRVLHLESGYTVRYLLPPASVAMFHLLFPDPWPKRRHNRRRVVTPRFLADVYRALAPDGILRVVTDEPDYFCAIKKAATEAEYFAVERSNDLSEYPVTTFEKHFRKSGLVIHRLALRKISPER